MHWDIFAGIDGTGDRNDAEYAATFADSCVKELKTKWLRQAMAWYERGPTMTDFSWDDLSRTDGLSKKALRHILTFWTPGLNAGKQPRIFLAGYSRGGAAAINTCHLLNQMNIPVHCLLLYDAVDRTPLSWMKAKAIPGNVARCFHAMRAPDTYSRTEFGHCGTEAPVGVLKKQEFFCTHGGMGGVPWKTAGKDGKIVEPLSPGSLGRQAQYASRPLGQLQSAPTVPLTTAVTLEQDASGSRAVRAWMSLLLFSVISVNQKSI